MGPKSLIFGITGQDGSYLAEKLLDSGHEIHGVVRRASTFNTGRIDHIFDKLHLHHGDMTDGVCVNRLIAEIKPDFCYNLSAQSHVAVSFELPDYTFQVNANGVLNLLEAIRVQAPECRLFQASTSEMFGSEPPPQHEYTRLDPLSPYAVGKVAAHKMCDIFREAYDMFISCGIMFNHESPRRGETFVTRKVAKTAAGGWKVYLGNLKAKRDWGYAPDYVDAMISILEYDEPRDFVVATGEMHTVEELCRKMYGYVGLNWEEYVVIDEKYKRPTDPPELCGNASLIKAELGWEPTIYFDRLCEIMVDAEREALK